MKRIYTAFLLAFSIVFPVGCIPPDNGEVLISELTFTDPRLKQCVEFNAENQLALFVSQLKYLVCIAPGNAPYGYEEWEIGLYSLEGLENLVSLEKLDLRGYRELDYDLTELVQLKELYLHDIEPSSISFPRENKLVDITLIYSSFQYEYLDFSSAQFLENLNLRGYANEELSLIANGNLKSLRVDNGLSITSGGLGVSNLDLTNNLLLESVSIKNVELQSLDLRALSNLQDLTLMRNYFLDSVQFGPNESLTSVAIVSTNLTSLDLSQVSNLKSVSLSQFEIADENILLPPSLENVEISGLFDVDSLSFIPTDNLLSLNLYYLNLITNLDLTVFPSLSDLSLYSLNNLESIEVSFLNQITTLYVSEIYNDSLDFDFSFLSHVEELDWSNNGLDPDLENLPQLQIFRSHGIASEELDFSRNGKLEYVRLQDMNIQSLNLTSNQRLSNLDINRTNLAEIDLSGNQFLVRASLTNNQLTTINVDNNYLLRSLYVYGNPLTQQTRDYLQTLDIEDLVY